MSVPIGEGSEVAMYILLFADDQVLITQEYEHMEFMVRKISLEVVKNLSIWGKNR